MSKAPTVSELVGNSNIIFKPAVGAHIEEGIRADYDTDSLWLPKKVPLKQRTMSVGSCDSEGLRTSTDSTLSNSSTSPVSVPRPRRLSISEMIFGSPGGGFSWRQNSLHNSPFDERHESITEDTQFKEFMKRQDKVLGDDGFKKKDYTK